MDIKQYKLRTLSAATDGFPKLNLIGHGRFGNVYKGVIPSRRGIISCMFRDDVRPPPMVAVRRLKKGSSRGKPELAREIHVLQQLNHPNIVKLKGCCLEKGEVIVVYEYLPRNLENVIRHGVNSRALDWEARKKIMIGIAEGVEYLHEQSKKAPVAHRGIRSSNILLDAAGMSPKLSDFYYAKLPGADDDAIAPVHPALRKTSTASGW